MNILHVISSVNPAGGGPIEGVRQLASALSSQGNSIEIVSLDHPQSDYLKSFPLKVYALGPSFFQYSYTPRLIPWLKTNAKNYDAVVVNGIWQYHSFGVWLALKNTEIPYFVFTHGMLDPWFKHRYPLKHLKKCLYWPWAEYRVLRDAKSVLFTCEEEAHLARKSFPFYRCNEHIVNYGTSGSPGDAVAQLESFYGRFPELRGKQLYLYLSRIHPKKGCDILIKAFCEICKLDPQAHLVLAGPDQVGWKQELVALSAKFGVENKITWPGMLSGDQKWGAYHAADVFVLPSHQENFGIVVAEALACGLPVLISDKVNIWREIVADNCGLVDTDTLEGTVRLFSRWLSMSNDDKNKMRVNAVHCFNNKFEITTAARSLIEAIKNYL